MFFASEEAFIEYTKSNNIIIEKVFSKSRK